MCTACKIGLIFGSAVFRNHFRNAQRVSTERENGRERSIRNDIERVNWKSLSVRDKLKGRLFDNQ